MLAVGVALVSAQAPAANNGCDISTGNTNVQPGDLGLNHAVADGDKRRTQARKGGNAFLAQTSPLRALQPQPDYVKYPVYAGVIDNMPIRIRLGRKVGEVDSVHGKYILDNAAGVRLVTDEYENGGLLMEESDNGIHVTGIWEGAIDGHGIVRDTWMDVTHDGHTLPFVLRSVAAVITPPYDAAINSNVVTLATPMTPLVLVGPGQIASPADKPTRSNAYW